MDAAKLAGYATEYIACVERQQRLTHDRIEALRDREATRERGRDTTKIDAKYERLLKQSADNFNKLGHAKHVLETACAEAQRRAA